MIAVSLAMVASVGIVCLTMVSLNNKKTKHVHKWWTEGVQVVDVMRPGSTIPARYETNISMSCESCGAKKIELLDGKWTSEIDKIK